MKLFSYSLCLAILSVPAAYGATISFEFGTEVVPNGYSIPSSGSYIQVGTQADFTVSGSTITASAFNVSGSGYQLTVDNNAVQERGLGVLSNGESQGTVREINSNEAVMLDFGSILASGGLVSSIRVGSLQGHSSTTPNDFEGFLLYAFPASTTPVDFAIATSGQLVYTSTYADTLTNQSVTVDLSNYSTDRYFVVQANPNNNIASSNDVALDAAIVTVPDSSVPEPGTVVFVIGALGMMALRKVRGIAVD